MSGSDVTFESMQARASEPHETCSSQHATAELVRGPVDLSTKKEHFDLDSPAPPVTTLVNTLGGMPTASDQAYGALDSHARHPSPVRVAEAPMPVDRRRKIAGFEQIARGHLREAGAPEAIELPVSLVDALEKAWKDADASQVETGGNVVRTYGGTYKLRRSEGGTNRLFEADEHDVGWGETMIGIAHTHPYRKEGLDHGTFSDGDIVNLVDESEPLKFLRSGPFTYAIARTKEFEALVKRHEQAQRIDDLKKAMKKSYNDAFSAFHGAFPDQLEAGVNAICKQFHLVYYQGQGAELRRVGGPSIQ
ncbi:MAG TPA: hypothetical protein VN253_23940 [Kofleriaceae bacterium]|nr:hypothetical protein [Kofleriaceae bacterium]